LQARLRRSSVSACLPFPKRDLWRGSMTSGEN